MTIILGILMVFLNYRILLPIIDGNLYRLILDVPKILHCLVFLTVVTVVTTNCKLHENKNKLYLKIKSIIEGIVIFIIILIGEAVVLSLFLSLFYNETIDILLRGVIALSGLVLLPLIFLIIPFIPVRLISNRTSRNFEKENERIIARNIARNKEIKAKEKEIKAKEEEERNRKFNKLYSETESNIYNIINKIDNIKGFIPFSYKNETSYIYDEELNLKSSISKEKWLNNDEKLNYYKELFENLNSKLYGNYEEYLKYLREKEKSISYILKEISYTFGCLAELVNTNENKIDSFNKYIKMRQSYIDLDYKGCKVGIEGENKVNQELSLYSNIINLSNIRLEVLDNNNTIQSIENDNILLTKNGIFVLEVKNFGELGNYDIVIEKDGRWVRENRYNKETTVLKNVTKQNNRHIAFLNKFINEGINRSFDDYIEAEGIVVIANEKVTIKNYNNNQNIFRDSEIYSYIKSQEAKFKGEELEKIRDLILSKNLPPKRYPIFDYSTEIIENIKMLEVYLKNYENLVNKLEIEYRNYVDKKSKI